MYLNFKSGYIHRRDNNEGRRQAEGFCIKNIREISRQIKLENVHRRMYKPFENRNPRIVWKEQVSKDERAWRVNLEWHANTNRSSEFSGVASIWFALLYYTIIKIQIKNVLDTWFWTKSKRIFCKNNFTGFQISFCCSISSNDFISFYNKQILNGLLLNNLNI